MNALDRALRIGGAGAIRRIGVITRVYAIHVVLAIGLAWPIARMLAGRADAHPRGDLLLFEPGAAYLAETLRLGRADLTSAFQGSTFALLGLLYLGLLPLAALIFALGRERSAKSPELAAAAFRSFAPLSLLLGMALILMATVGSLPLSIAGLLEIKVHAAFGDRGGDIVEFGIRALAFVAAAVVGVGHDLARVAVVSRNRSALGGATLAAAALRAHPAAALGGWSLRAAAGLFLLTLVARATTQVGIDTGSRLALVMLLHQAVAFVLVFLRADWLALAHHVVDATAQTSER